MLVGAWALFACADSSLQRLAHPQPPAAHYSLPARRPVRASPPPPLQADGGPAAQQLRSDLQGQLQWLVSNYSTRRQSLLEEILPEVGAAMAAAGGVAFSSC